MRTITSLLTCLALALAFTATADPQVDAITALGKVHVQTMQLRSVTLQIEAMDKAIAGALVFQADTAAEIKLLTAELETQIRTAAAATKIAQNAMDAALKSPSNDVSPLVVTYLAKAGEEKALLDIHDDVYEEYAEILENIQDEIDDMRGELADLHDRAGKARERIVKHQRQADEYMAKL